VTRAPRLKATLALGVAAAIAIALAPRPAPAAFPGENGKLAFQSNRDGNVDIYSMNADGSGVRRLTSRDDSDRVPSHSASGHLIAFERFFPGEISGDEPRLDVFLMSADGSKETFVAENGGDPAWSPDGQRIAFQRPANGEIYVVDADGTDLVRLTRNAVGDGEPAWSPDGRQIAFQTTRDGPAEIYVMDADGTDARRVTNDNLPDLAPNWSPDGSRIAFEKVAPNGNADIAVINADGSGQTRLTTHPADDRAAAWSPDGTRIAFTTGRDGNAEIYVMGSDGTGQTNVSNNPATDSRPDWAVVPGRKELADLPPPAIGKTANLDPSGRVLLGVRRGGRGASAAQKGVRFVALKEARQVPVGSFVNTRRGRIRLQTAAKSGERQAGTFSGGLFQVLQSRRGRTKGLTSLKLKGSSFRRCASASGSARAAASIVRRLRSRARGRFRTRGRHSAATVRGTTWVTVDRCDGTLTAVKKGRVVVRDFRLRRNIVVRAGKSYLAKAP
jgi:Tol biopolymer transport system component